jgi:hypothetical protein
MANWSELQSICQLSVALNVGLNAVLAFDSTFDQRVLVKLQRWQSVIEHSPAANQPESSRFLFRIMALRSAVVTGTRRTVFDNLVTKAICLVCACIAACGLYAASFVPTSGSLVPSPVKWLMILTLAPVMVVSIYVFGYSSFVTLKYRKDLREIDLYVRDLAAQTAADEK